MSKRPSEMTVDELMTLPDQSDEPRGQEVGGFFVPNMDLPALHDIDDHLTFRGTDGWWHDVYRLGGEWVRRRRARVA